MHGSRQKKECPKCSSLISVPNFNKHERVCTGEGTILQRDERKKEATALADAKGHTCAQCDKVFSSIQALKGHESRSHTLRHKQVERGELGRRKQHDMRQAGHVFPVAVHTAEFKEQQSLRMIERLSKKPFWSKREVYNGVTLDSSYEVAVAKSLDENNVVWERPSHGLKWFDGEQNRHYLPDFYLPEYDVYLDPKNDFLIGRDEMKIRLASEQNDVRVIVLDKHHLTWDKILLVL